MLYSKENLEKMVNESNNFSDVTRKLGLRPFYGNRQTVKKYIKLFNINTNHFRNYGTTNRNKNKKKLEDILVENSTYIYTSNLKEKLYNAGLKKRLCEICNQGEIWNNKKISLILDHINGVNNDNRIENLRIVCPNCNATLPTHGGKNVKHNEKKITKCKCGVITYGNNKTCISCSNVKQRKVDRPEYTTLLEEIKTLGYVGTGKKYGVSDNAIRKWKKYYEKNNYNSNS